MKTTDLNQQEDPIKMMKCNLYTHMLKTIRKQTKQTEVVQTSYQYNYHP